MKRLNQPLLIGTNLTRNEADMWYFKAVFEVEKLKKELDIESPGNFAYSGWRKCEKSVENFLSLEFNLRWIPLVYVIRKDDEPKTIMSDDISYDVDPEDWRINAAPLTGKVFKRDNVKFHKLLNSLTQGNKAWKWIEKSKWGTDSMNSLREYHDVSAKVERRMKIIKAGLKELYFKRQDVFPFEKNVNGLKEAYNTLEELNQSEFE